MSNELIISTGANLPDYLREEGVGYVDEGLADGIAIRSPKLSVTTAKEFTITKEGKTQILEQRSVRVVIIASSNTLTKAWYEKAFVPGSTEAPDCFSNDGKVPAAGVSKPQHTNCASCPKNAFGSHPTTGRGKACGDRKLIVCVWEGDPETLMTFNAPTMTLSNLAKLNSELKSANVPLQSVLVELSFDPGVTYPVVKLNAVGFVDKASLLRFKSLADTDVVKAMLREVDYEAAEAAPVVPDNVIKFGQAGQGAAQADANAPADSTVSAGAETSELAALQAKLAALTAAANKPAEPTPEQIAAKQLEELKAQLAEKLRLEEQAKAEAAEKLRLEEEAKAATPKTELELLQEQIAALTAKAAGTVVEPANTVDINVTTPAPAKRTRRTKEQMEADRLAKQAGGDAAPTPKPETATDPVLEGEVETAGSNPVGTAGAPDVLALLKKWQS